MTNSFQQRFCKLTGLLLNRNFSRLENKHHVCFPHFSRQQSWVDRKGAGSESDFLLKKGFALRGIEMCNELRQISTVLLAESLELAIDWLEIGLKPRTQEQ